MWIELLAMRLVFPDGAASKAWLTTNVAPLAITLSGGLYTSAYWSRSAARAGRSLRGEREAPVSDLLRRAGQVDVRGEIVTLRGAQTEEEADATALVLGALASFVRAAEHGGRGAVFQLGVQEADGGDAVDLVHWLDDDGVHGVTLAPEEALAIRDRVHRFDGETFDPALYDEHPSGADDRCADDDG